MTTTTTTRWKPTVALILWESIPEPVRRSIRCRVPLKVTLEGEYQGLVVAVGSGTPLRWLLVTPTEGGLLRVEVHEVRPKGTKVLVEGETTGDQLSALLQRMGKELGLGV